jgi:hypothetical protein
MEYWSNGVMEHPSHGVMGKCNNGIAQYSNIPVLQYSIFSSGGESDGKKNREQSQEEKSRKGIVA